MTEAKLQVVAFGRDDIENELARMAPDEIDALPFGAVELDATGMILTYNMAESSLTGRRREDVIGRNFFTEVAPCTNTPSFRGAFDHGVKAGALNTMIEYVFDHNMAATKVKVHMKSSIMRNSYWIFVKRL